MCVCVCVCVCVSVSVSVCVCVCVSVCECVYDSLFELVDRNPPKIDIIVKTHISSFLAPK